MLKAWKAWRRRRLARAFMWWFDEAVETYDQRATDRRMARRHFKALARCNRLSMALQRYGLTPELVPAQGGDP